MIYPTFKCFFLNQSYLENELYRAVLRDQLQINEGMMVENVVAQCLKANGHRAYFYAERNPETRKTMMEIDFLIRQGKKLVPIEVKSSGRRTSNRFCASRKSSGNASVRPLFCITAKSNDKTTCGICRTTWQRCFEPKSRTIRKVGVKFASNSLAQKFRSRAFFLRRRKRAWPFFVLGRFESLTKLVPI